MGQLKTLLWKNFKFCRRHYIKTALFYALPLLFTAFLLLTIVLSKYDNVSDCAYQTLFYPPSHPLLVVSSLVCINPLEECVNWKDNYQTPDQILHSFSNLTITDPKQSRLCPGKTFDEASQLIKQSMGATCLPRDKSTDEGAYDAVREIDFVYRGRVLYYPNNANTSLVMQKAIENLDRILELNITMNLFMNGKTEIDGGNTAADLDAVTTGMGELVNATFCYQSLQGRVEGFDNLDQALDRARKMDFAEEAVWGIIHFIDVDKYSEYRLIHHNGQRDSIPALYLQSLIETSIIKKVTGNGLATQLSGKLLPKRCHKNPEGYGPAFSSVSFVLAFGFVMLCYTISSEICFEKSVGLLEFLFIAGVPRWKIKLSWFIFGSVFFISISLILSLIFKFIHSKLIEHTSFILIFFVMLLYALSLLCMCFLCSSLMSTSQRAGILIFTSILAAYFVPSWAQILPNVGYTGGKLLFVKMATFCHSTVAAQVAFAYIFAWEQLNKAAHVYKSPDDDDNFKGILECMIYLIIQCPMYLFLSWYFDHVAPSKYGIKWPAYFLCMPSYWNPSASANDEHESTKVNKNGEEEELADIEPMDPHHPKTSGIEIRTLTKSYGKNKLAVDRLSVTFYQNEITALLGHNGAGKSTTMNMLTGMIAPTSGDAIIEGKEISGKMKQIRTTLGFCPQYDIIYPELTVKDHMMFYGDLKAMEVDQVELYYMDIFRQMKMVEALNTPAASLSGGMKRKLSIAIALMGNPTTIILDEPTSAIDPFSRRAIWDVILNFRNKSTVLISTHYMQEADVLGDRIAIVDKGRLKCSGTPMYLKARYGSGFKLTLAHRAPIDYDAAHTTLQEIVPMDLTGNSNTETTFSIPLEAARSQQMVQVFHCLETNKESLGIESFGISESTLEHVFFNVAEGGQNEKSDEEQTATNDKLANFDYKNKTGFILYMIQLWGTWVKRFHISRKSIIGFVFQILAPILFTAILLLMTKTIASSGLSGDIRHVHPWNTSVNNEIFYSGSQTGSFVDTLLAEGPGTRCMDPAKLSDKSCDTGNTGNSMPAVTTHAGYVECSCDICPADATNPAANSVMLGTYDKLINLETRNITDYLIKTTETRIIGGIETAKFSSTPLTSTTFFTTFAASYPALTSNPLWAQLDALFNTPVMPLDYDLVWAGILDPPGREPTKFEKEMRAMKSAFMNAYNNILLRENVPAGERKIHGITLYAEEMSMNDEISFTDAVGGLVIGFFGSLALMMPTFTVLLVIVTEHSSGNKRLQTLMGLSKIVYWLANFCWDILLFIISLSLMVIFMAIFKNDFNIDLGLVFTTGLMYGISMILLGYVLSFIVKNARTAILMIGLIAPFFAIAAIILMIFSKKKWYNDVSTILNFFPPYFIADSLALVSINDKIPATMRDPIFAWKNLGKRYVISAVFSFLTFLTLVCFELGLFASLKRIMCEPDPPKRVGPGAPERDRDVETEKRRIMHQQHSGGKPSDEKDAMAVTELTKIYGNNKVAVKGVTFGVHAGECFGLLGVNGAGKTTLFKMLTGFHQPTIGDATIMEHSIFKHPGKVAKHMSYCPQEDVLFESLTPGEHLHLYGRIRGIPGDQLSEVVEVLINTVGLSPHTKKQSHALSGGNKRKLNFSIAALDFPSVIFLDEMTTGMDPKARRAAWTCLETAVKKGCAAVITSHSMEECEALCNRIVIMVNGSFQCIGGVQYLKDKYGNNYSVKFRLEPGVNEEQLQEKITEQFPATKLVEKHLGYLELEIPADGLQLSTLFELIHENKTTFSIEEFSASQTTLEHVFVNMVRDQE